MQCNTHVQFSHHYQGVAELGETDVTNQPMQMPILVGYLIVQELQPLITLYKMRPASLLHTVTSFTQFLEQWHSM